MAESFRAVPQAFELAPPVRLSITAREWLLHGALFLLTVCTTTLAGMMLVAPELPGVEPPLATPLDYLLYIPLSYWGAIAELLRFALAHPPLIAKGVTFSASLLAILFSHEMGHYLACRYYKVSATLPYFIPAPPLFLAGTFGAFIKIRSGIPTRRALFDIGLGRAAGRVCGCAAAVGDWRNDDRDRRSRRRNTRSSSTTRCCFVCWRSCWVCHSIQTRRSILTTWRRGSDCW
jgi:hypothetical protein